MQFFADLVMVAVSFEALKDDGWILTSYVLPEKQRPVRTMIPNCKIDW